MLRFVRADACLEISIALMGFVFTHFVALTKSSAVSAEIWSLYGLKGLSDKTHESSIRILPRIRGSKSFGCIPDQEKRER
jgi:hypothetical protein